MVNTAFEFISKFENIENVVIFLLFSRYVRILSERGLAMLLTEERRGLPPRHMKIDFVVELAYSRRDSGDYSVSAIERPSPPHAGLVTARWNSYPPAVTFRDDPVG